MTAGSTYSSLPGGPLVRVHLSLIGVHMRLPVCNRAFLDRIWLHLKGGAVHPLGQNLKVGLSIFPRRRFRHGLPGRQHPSEFPALLEGMNIPVTQHGVEQSHELAEHIKSKGHSVDHGDFLEHTGQYDRVLMNPPFEKDQAIDHVRHAFEQLKPGGKLVAVVPGNERLYSEGKGKRSDFHGWASTHGDFHELPDNAFAGDDSVRKTGVKTSLLVMRKPETGSE